MSSIHLQIINVSLLVILQASLPLFAAPCDSLQLEAHFQKVVQYINITPLPDSALHYLDHVEVCADELDHATYYVLSKLARFRVLTETQQYDIAEKVAYAALEAAKKRLPAGDFLIGNSLINLGIHFGNKGSFAREGEFYKQAMAYYDEQSQNLNILGGAVSLRQSIGLSYRSGGDFELAIEQFQRALDLTRAHWQEDPFFTNNYIQIQFELAQLYFLMEEYPKAIEGFEQNLATIKEAGRENRINHLRTLHRLAEAYQKNHQLEKALEIGKVGLTVQAAYQERTGHPFEQEVGLTILGQIYTELQQFDLAAPYFHQALLALEAQLTNLPRHPRRGSILISQGIFYQKSHQPQKALRTLQEALINYTYDFKDSTALTNPQPSEVGISPPKLFMGLTAKAELLHQLGVQQSDETKLLAALDTYELLLQLVDQKRQTLYGNGSKFFLLSQAVPAYEQAISLSYELYQKAQDFSFAEKAFQLAEKSKAILLFDALKNSAARISAEIDPALLEKEHSLRINEAFYQKQLYQENRKESPSDSIIQNYKSQFYLYRDSLISLVEQFEIKYPEYYQLRFSEHRLSISEIQAHLPRSSTQLIDYFVGKDNIFVFGLSSDQMSIHQIAFTDSLQQSLETLLTALHQGNTFSKTAFNRHSHQLFQALIEPVWTPGEGELWLIPDAELGYLPFEVLLTKAPNPSASYRELPYLLHEKSIQYGYSARLMFTDLKNQAVETITRKWLGYAPVYPDQEALFFNKEEVNQIALRVGGTVKAGEEATLADFFQAAPTANMLHLSMHGYPNEERPMYSYLKFSPSHSEADSNQLFAYQLFSLPLSANLVVLSACKSGYGPLARGEGIRSLSRAFRYAGCPNVINSLWNAEGATAKTIFPNFYQYLEQGDSKAQALRKAKLDYLKEAPPFRQNPRFWAPFILVGEAEPTSRFANTWWIWLLGGLGGVSVLLLWGFKRKS